MFIVPKEEKLLIEKQKQQESNIAASPMLVGQVAWRCDIDGC